MALNALDRHLALVGFMGAGKTTVAAELGARLNRHVLSVDREIEESEHRSPAEFFAELGEAAFREFESNVMSHELRMPFPVVVDTGGGAVTHPGTRLQLRNRAFTVLLDVDVDTAWQRVRGSDRPLAQDEQAFRPSTRLGVPLYSEVADATVVSGDIDGVVLAAAGVRHERGSLDRLGKLVPGRRSGRARRRRRPSSASTANAPATALGERLVSTHALPAGERAKQLAVVERLWHDLALDRDGTIVALGGGTTTDAAGFAAATYLRGVPWVAVPTTLVGQVDAAIGGKTGSTPSNGKNLAGAFHWPERVVIDDTLLATLPERELRNGEAERLKTELLAGRPLDARGAAAYKAALCLRDPSDRGPRRWLNLGHTFGHALEAAADFELPHGEAVSLGLLAALEAQRPRPGSGARGARPAAGAGRPRPGLGGAPARQETLRRCRSISSCSETTARPSRPGRQTRFGPRWIAS